MNSKYKTPERFKRALEDRIRKEAIAKGIDIATFRQKCIFDRFLARIHAHFGESAVLKGGVALALLVERARLTRDVDLMLHGRPNDFLDMLQGACALDLGDFLEFEAGPDPRFPTIEGEGIAYEGLRFRIEAKLAGKIYGSRFGLDVGFGDRMLVPPEVRHGNDFFSFAELPVTTIRAYAREVHLAEKLHAYTLPRPNENSRVKDLPDIVLLAMAGTLDAMTLRNTVEATFTFRSSHSMPNSLPAPPTSWISRYADLARENALPWPTIDNVFERASTFLNPVLAGSSGTWNPDSWSWVTSI
ncbi:MAG TPA: nucleotidyl transferase AbiEii/AbiGii toxin family protein [Polyangium sp.]|nr:nucleotidyl transferase AbiEii/AbiGii toxin family protein [Polyangium sp.]